MKAITVLSLFDGMSCGRLALERAGVNVLEYYASEIDKYAIQVAMKNYPDTKQVGNVTELKSTDFSKIDLLIGGSPCQDLSKAKTDGKGLNGSNSGLFWEYVRLLKELKPTYFLFENVIMKKEWVDIINNELGCESIEINSNLVSAQNRRRLYWTNIPNIIQPKDKGILLGDIIYDDTYKVFTDERITKTKKITKNYIKWDLSGKKYWSQQDRAYFKEKKICTLPKANPANKLNIVLDYENDIYRRIHPVEAERCQNVPDDYTSGVKDNKRLEMLGNGWTVDVIAHIFSYLKENEMELEEQNLNELEKLQSKKTLIMKIDISKIKVGDKVCYQPAHYETERWENGMIKEIPEHTDTALRVVYNCNGDWKEFKNYTSALTNLKDLKLGWKH